MASDETPFAEAYQLVGGGLVLLGEYATEAAPTLDAWFASDPAIRKLKILGEAVEAAEDNS